MIFSGVTAAVGVGVAVDAVRVVRTPAAAPAAGRAPTGAAEEVAVAVGVGLAPAGPPAWTVTQTEGAGAAAVVAERVLVAAPVGDVTTK
jgi:hypothetical protein